MYHLPGDHFKKFFPFFTKITWFAVRLAIRDRNFIHIDRCPKPISKNRIDFQIHSGPKPTRPPGKVNLTNRTLAGCSERNLRSVTTSAKLFLSPHTPGNAPVDTVRKVHNQLYLLSWSWTSSRNLVGTWVIDGNAVYTGKCGINSPSHRVARVSFLGCRKKMVGGLWAKNGKWFTKPR